MKWKKFKGDENGVGGVHLLGRISEWNPVIVFDSLALSVFLNHTKKGKEDYVSFGYYLWIL